MKARVHDQFEAELARRGCEFAWDPASQRYVIEIGGGTMQVSLDNLIRDVTADRDEAQVAHFVDAVIASTRLRHQPPSADNLYWSLEPGDYVEPPEYRHPVTDLVDRVLVHLSPDQRLISWATTPLLERLGLSESAASRRAFANLAGQLAAAELQVQEVHSVRLGILATRLPFKTALLLAPNLKDVTADKLGWPLLAIAPDRDFLYLWPAAHPDFAGRVGPVVVREFTRSSYPLSTEVYELSDTGLRAIGAFPVNP